MRNRPSGATLQPTALVHEVFLHLTSTKQSLLESRNHFLGVAALAMRQVIAGHYRRSSAPKRGGDVVKVELSEDGVPAKPGADYLDLDRALNRLEAEAPELSRIVELRFFGGMSAEECAQSFFAFPRPRSIAAGVWRVPRYTES